MSSREDKLPLLQHLRELRKVVVFSVIAIAVGFIVVFLAFSEQLLTFFSRPLLERDVEIINIGLAEPFVAQMRASFVAGFVLASPLVFGKFWSFLKPALFPRERALFRLVFVIVMLLFISGVLFAYIYVFNITVNFFLLMGQNVAVPQITIDMYIRMLFNFVIPFGLAFQLPVVVFLLYRLGMVTLEALTKKRKYIVFAVFVVATLITPPDVWSQIMLALPLLLLYEISIIVIRIASRKKPIESEDDDNDS
ncbi:MAG: twin-arginine translocase subunit TatC [Clostridiales bacterium]|jgi:sec-independent protein translocase protein TatC|nr:twin-arginine translocase subunit TatC [Clostridiales bacterium]